MRQDNIVIYAAEDTDMKQLNKFFDTFVKECEGADVLPEDQDTLRSGKKVKKGITTGPEFPIAEFYKTLAEADPEGGLYVKPFSYNSLSGMSLLP